MPMLAGSTTSISHSSVKRSGDNQMGKGNGKIKKVSSPRRYRDALTGRFVTRKYAKKNRETTVKVPRAQT
jgi:hypothetical protein